MADVDTEGMKSTLAELSRRASAGSRVRRPPRDQPPPKSEVELRSLLESDPSVAKLASVLTQRLAERVAAQKVAQAEQRAQAEIDNATTAKIADAIEAERAALELLAQSNAETFVTLTKPLFIAQLPQTEYGQFKDQHIEPFNSWFKVDINDSSGGTGLEHHLTGANTSFVAYYLWENPSDQYAFGSVKSNMVLRGWAAANGSPGKLYGNWADLYITVGLTPIRWTGWGADAAGNSLDGTPYPLAATKEIVNWQCYGGDWFSSDSGHPNGVPLNPSNPLSIPTIAIPGRAVTVFELSLYIDWGFHADWGGGYQSAVQEPEIDDAVIVDLYSGEHQVWCGAVVLDLR